MPGFDGTGPAGQGPMSGACRGFCIAKLPASEEQPETGFAGLQGWFFSRLRTDLGERLYIGMLLNSLQQRIRRLQQRILALEAADKTAG